MNTTKIMPASKLLCFNLGEVLSYRELLFFFVWRDIKVRYKQTIIGIAWAILQPLFAMVVFTIFFGKIAGIATEGIPRPLFYYSSSILWLYFASSLSAATNVLVENQRMITKVYFPRIVLPLSSVLSGLVDFFISFVLLLAMFIYYGISPHATLFLAPLFVLLAVITTFSLGVWLSAFNAIYRDVRYIVPFFVQFWMFASPVIYPSSLVREKYGEIAYMLYGLNPMVGILEGFRWSLFQKGTLPELCWVSFLMVIICLIAGSVYFYRTEDKIIDLV